MAFIGQGKSDEVVPKLKQDMKAILITNWKVWIPFQFFNFNFVPQKLQVGPACASFNASYYLDDLCINFIPLHCMHGAPDATETGIGHKVCWR